MLFYIYVWMLCLEFMFFAWWALDWCTKLGTPTSSSYAFHFLLWSHPSNTPTFLHTNDESISHLRYGTRSCLENWRMLRNSTRIMLCLKKGSIHFFVSALQVTTRPPPAMLSDSMGENRSCTDWFVEFLIAVFGRYPSGLYLFRQISLFVCKLP